MIMRNAFNLAIWYALFLGPLYAWTLDLRASLIGAAAGTGVVVVRSRRHPAP
jgi:hypothetical protein